MLEFISLELPQAFVDHEMNITRLAETIIFVLNRSTTGPDSKTFEDMLNKEFSSKFTLELILEIHSKKLF